jgi:hypothetical protein
MSPFLKILASHPVSTLVLLVLLFFVWPEVLTTEEKTLAVLTLMAVGLSIAVLLEVWSRRRRHGLKKRASRQPLGHTSRRSHRLSHLPHLRSPRISRPTRPTRKRA